MKKHIFALLTVLILFVGHALAGNTARNYPELECVHGNMTYTIAAGDTLSEIAQHYRKSMATIANVQANNITDIDRIYVAKSMIIPCSASPRMATNRMPAPKAKNVAAASAKIGYVGTFAPDPTPRVEINTNEDISATIEPVALSTLPVELSAITVPSFVAASSSNNETVATHPEQAPTPQPARSSTQKIKVTGYRMLVPHEAAFENGKSVIPLNIDLPTALNLSNGEKIQTISRAHVVSKQKDVLLSIMLRDSGLPSVPYTITIEGVPYKLDGKAFKDNSKLFRGRFPGQPRTGLRTLLTIGKIGASAALMSITLGGLEVGVPVAVGAWAIPAIKHHHDVSVERKDAAAIAAITATANARTAAATARIKSLKGE